VLNMARQGVELQGVVSFHGALDAVKPAQPGRVKAKILVLTGADDKFVPPEQVDAFKQEMRASAADVQVISYPGAVHSFTNPTRMPWERNLTCRSPIIGRQTGNPGMR